MSTLREELQRKQQRWMAERERELLGRQGELQGLTYTVHALATVLCTCLH